jgi:hypothetical protein
MMRGRRRRCRWRQPVLKVVCCWWRIGQTRRNPEAGQQMPAGMQADRPAVAVARCVLMHIIIMQLPTTHNFGGGA